VSIKKQFHIFAIKEYFPLIYQNENINMKQRIYIDTSVVGGCFDEEFKDGYPANEIRSPKDMINYEDE